MPHDVRIVLPVLTLFASLFIFHTAHASTIQLPQTGQTTTYAAGDDGALKIGKPWPAPRFTDNGNGSVTDNLTGLIWLKNAGCFDTVGGIPKGTTALNSTLTWLNALTWSNNLAAGPCGLTDGSSAGAWRLPNITELESLMDAQLSHPSLPAGHPFTGVQSLPYWSSTTYKNATNDNAWFIDLNDSSGDKDDKGGAAYHVWPVRGGL